MGYNSVDITFRLEREIKKRMGIVPMVHWDNQLTMFAEYRGTEFELHYCARSTDIKECWRIILQDYLDDKPSYVQHYIHDSSGSPHEMMKAPVDYCFDGIPDEFVEVLKMKHHKFTDYAQRGQIGNSFLDVCC